LLDHAEGRSVIHKSSYGERDYAFGQRILTLRTHLGLTQAGLADRLGVSRRAVAEWEAGSNYPKAKHLTELIVLAVRASAFPAGREAEEIRALWKVAHQKLLLDEVWLQGLLARQPSGLADMVPQTIEQAINGDQVSNRSTRRPRRDWGEALAVPSFYGRLYWWDLRHGESVRVCKAHEGSVQALKVSPDDRRLASCGDDGAIRIWDLHSGEHLGTLRRDRPYERLTITGIRGLTQAEIATLRALGAVEDGLAVP
jgi:transcriptional regulator with XRE-family HTH domain